jgi:PKD repeat protein
MKKNILVKYLFLIGLFFLSSCKKENNNPDAQPPDASFSYNSSRQFPVSVQFSNTSTGNIALSTFAWYFGDGTSLTSALNPVHNYTIPAVYQVMLVQTDPSGVKDSITSMISLTANGPSGISSKVSNVRSVNFTFTIPSVFNVNFTNNSSDSNSFLWEFGDGTTSATDSVLVRHTYFGSGPFRAKLTAKGDGGVDTSSVLISF